MSRPAKDKGPGAGRPKGVSAETVSPARGEPVGPGAERRGTVTAEPSPDRPWSAILRGGEGSFTYDDPFRVVFV